MGALGTGRCLHGIKDRHALIGRGSHGSFRQRYGPPVGPHWSPRGGEMAGGGVPAPSLPPQGAPKPAPRSSHPPPNRPDSGGDDSRPPPPAGRTTAPSLPPHRPHPTTTP